MASEEASSPLIQLLGPAPHVCRRVFRANSGAEVSAVGARAWGEHVVFHPSPCVSLDLLEVLLQVALNGP